ncbi:hypothetical protein RRG08_062152 [Elysia crispata]|uniref:Uncharacterized protein n=1 Tax=Elysia crispata TaxID=231223 RepID=A0AAE1CXY2_9GAST|nr:hypothetical protein RRG08_062152 [Elysia crispata]
MTSVRVGVSRDHPWKLDEITRGQHEICPLLLTKMVAVTSSEAVAVYNGTHWNPLEHNGNLRTKSLREAANFVSTHDTLSILHSQLRRNFTSKIPDAEKKPRDLNLSRITDHVSTHSHLPTHPSPTFSARPGADQSPSVMLSSFSIKLRLNLVPYCYCTVYLFTDTSLAACLNI